MLPKNSALQENVYNVGIMEEEIDIGLCYTKSKQPYTSWCRKGLLNMLELLLSSIDSHHQLVIC